MRREGNDKKYAMQRGLPRPHVQMKDFSLILCLDTEDLLIPLAHGQNHPGGSIFFTSQSSLPWARVMLRSSPRCTSV